jgi:hypothetical protein
MKEETLNSHTYEGLNSVSSSIASDSEDRSKKRFANSEKTSLTHVPPATDPGLYIRCFVDAYNSGEIILVQQLLNSICTNDVMIVKRFYPSLERVACLEDNQQQDFLSSIYLTSLSQFYQFLENCYLLLPDSTYQIVQPTRCCYEDQGNGYVFILGYHFSGSLLFSSSTLRNNLFSSDPTVNPLFNQSLSRIIQLNAVRSKILDPLFDTESSTQSSFFETQGSIIFHVNHYNLVYQIEIYETSSVSQENKENYYF